MAEITPQQRKALKLAEEGAAIAAALEARDAQRAGKVEAKVVREKRAREDTEDPALLLCSSQDLRVELRECFDQHGVLLPRDEHHPQLLRERDAFLALGIFPGNLAAQNRRVDQQMCDTFSLLDWLDENTEVEAGSLADCRQLVKEEERGALPAGWCLGDHRTLKLRKATLTYSTACFLVNALKHVASSYAGGHVSAYAGAHLCRTDKCLAAGHVALRCNTGQMHADHGCAGSTADGGKRCMHGMLLDEDGVPRAHDGLCCRVPGSSIPHPDSAEPAHRLDGDALGSAWVVQGSQEQIQLKQELRSLVEAHGKRVTYPIHKFFTGDGMPFEDGAVCECLELDVDWDDKAKLPYLGTQRVHLNSNYPHVQVNYSGGQMKLHSLVNLFFLGNPHHSTGVSGHMAVHRCHNPLCVDEEHVYLAPHSVNSGTDACAGGAYCASDPDLLCLRPGAHSFGTARYKEWEGAKEEEEGEEEWVPAEEEE